jgi:hypothetical protein
LQSNSNVAGQCPLYKLVIIKIWITKK